MAKYIFNWELLIGNFRALLLPEYRHDEVLIYRRALMQAHFLQHHI